MGKISWGRCVRRLYSLRHSHGSSDETHREPDYSLRQQARRGFCINKRWCGWGWWSKGRRLYFVHHFSLIPGINDKGRCCVRRASKLPVPRNQVQSLRMPMEVSNVVWRNQSMLFCLKSEDRLLLAFRWRCAVLCVWGQCTDLGRFGGCSWTLFARVEGQRRRRASL